MNKLTVKKTLVIKLILLFIGVVVLTLLIFVLVKYQVLKPSDSQSGIVSLQYLAKKGNSDTSPDKRASEKTATDSTSQKNTDETNQLNSKQQKNIGGTKKIDPVDPPAEIYAVQPIIFFGSDTSFNLTNYTKQVDINFAGVKNWYKNQLGGKTFNLVPAVGYRSALSESELLNKYSGGLGMWVDGLGAAAIANNLELCNDRRFYYFVTPLDNVAGGMIGAENLGCAHVLPGTASIPNQMGRLIGGIIDPDWPEWWADEIREAQGGVAHEIGHGLGASCVGGVCNGLPHAPSGSDSIMFGWWNFGTTGIFLDSEKTAILKSPFIN